MHVGRHRSGTTALQRFFSDNETLLANESLLYPRAGRKELGHHQLTRSIRGDGELLDALHSEIAGHDGSVILSSELLQSVSPKKLALALPVGDTDIVVYLREQVDYLVSDYAQRVKATDYTASFETFLQQRMDSTERAHDYLRQVRAWGRHFGEEHVKVRIYDRNELPSGSTVADFCSIYDITHSPTHSKIEVNTSFTGELLAAKRLLNATTLAGTGNTSMAMIERLREVGRRFPSRPPEIDAAIATRIRDQFAAQNLALFDEFVADGRDDFHKEALAEPTAVNMNRVIEIVEQILAT